MDKKKKKIIRMAGFVLLSMFIFNSCSVEKLLKKTNVRKPEVAMEKVEISKVTLKDVTLLFTIDIHNPNPIPLNLAGLNYQLEVNQHPFVQGEKQERIDIHAKAISSVGLPVTISFADLLGTVRSLSEKDSSDYRLSCSLLFQVPILGEIRIPLSHSGRIPILKMPKISLAAVKLERLTFQKASLKLRLAISNPNKLALLLNSFRYNFEVEGVPWATGEAKNELTIRSDSKSEVEIPINLSLQQIGSSLVDWIRNRSPLNYSFKGKFQLALPGSAAEKTSLDIDEQGRFSIVQD